MSHFSEPSNLVVCELGPTDDDILEEEGSEQQTFADWINEFTKHTMANLPDDRSLNEKRTTTNILVELVCRMRRSEKTPPRVYDVCKKINR